jgi:cell division protein FtsN
MAKRSKPQARRSGGLKYGLVLLMGLLLGLGAALAWYLYGDRGKLDALLPTPNPQAEAERPRPEREPVAQEPKAPAKPQYDFYTVLPEKEVALPEAEAAAEPPQGTPAAETPAAAPAANGGQLQAGAFSNAADAEALKAQIAMAGQTARVEAITVDGRTLHRVRLGPFATDAEREAARQALAGAGVNAAPVR